MKDLGHAPFIYNCPEYEPLDSKPTPLSLIEEYQKADFERTNSNSNWPVVFDYVEPSPMYEGENSKFGPFIDEKDNIELPAPTEQGNGSINEPYQRRYYFNPQNLPYNLE
jgi:hypothetical protein